MNLLYSIDRNFQMEYMAYMVIQVIQSVGISICFQNRERLTVQSWTASGGRVPIALEQLLQDPVGEQALYSKV